MKTVAWTLADFHENRPSSLVGQPLGSSSRRDGHGVTVSVHCHCCGWPGEREVNVCVRLRCWHMDIDASSYEYKTFCKFISNISHYVFLITFLSLNSLHHMLIDIYLMNSLISSLLL